MSQWKKTLLRGMALAMALLLCLAGTVPVTGAAAEEEEQEIVSSYPYTSMAREKVNLRASRSVKSELKKRIPAGAEITVLGKNGGWANVEYNGTKGWVRTEYIVLKTVKKIKETPTPTPIPTLSPEENAGGYSVLKRGSSGRDVRSLQEAMIELGYLTGSADGNFGESTEKAVSAFQKKNGYPDTGLVDANIQAFLYSGKPLNAKGTAVKINTVSPVPGSTMRLNSSGYLVGELQSRLKELGYYTGSVTNKYDTETRKAVNEFQKKNGLKADGLAGAQTRKLIENGGVAADAPAPTAEPTPTAEPIFIKPATTVRADSKGDDAKSVQIRLQELGYYRGKVDGNFGRASVNALKSFQANNGLKADGIAGKGTYDILFSVNAVPFSVPETPTPTPAPTATPTPRVSVWTTLRSGMKGDEVKQLQENLIQMGYLDGKPDGNYGSGTVAAVTAFQRANGLKADGVAGESTLKALYGGTAKAAEVKATATPKPDTQTSSSSVSSSSGSLKEGSTGAKVQELQTRLIALGYLTGKADGVFGKKTTEAVKAFQRASKLKSDGIAGSRTLTLLETTSKAGTAKATNTPVPTATPTPVPGAVAALTGNPSASKVIYANWYTTVKEICKKYPYVTVFDYSTGISWQIHIFSVGAHADFEPVTANDTARMQRAFGGETTWNPKPVWVIFPDGSVYMASTHDTPHGTSHNTDNNFDGHACLHFPRTQEQVTSIGPYATSHQEMIDKGWAATQQMK